MMMIILDDDEGARVSIRLFLEIDRSCYYVESCVGVRRRLVVGPRVGLEEVWIGRWMVVRSFDFIVVFRRISEPRSVYLLIFLLLY